MVTKGTSMSSLESVPSFKLNVLPSDLNTLCDCFLQDFFVDGIELHLGTASLTQGLPKHHGLFSIPHCSLPSVLSESVLDLVLLSHSNSNI